MIDNLEELGATIQSSVAGIEGPAFTDHGYLASRTMTFWSADRRVHFYFENLRGAISVIVEVAQRRPKTSVSTGKLHQLRDAPRIVDLFLKKKKPVDALPDLGWVKGGAHDELVAHPPDKPGQPVSIGLVGSISSGQEPDSAETKWAQITTKILSQPTQIEGLGGITVYARDVEKLATWYRERLGIPMTLEGESYQGKVGTLSFTIMPSASKIAEGVRMLLTFKVQGFDTFVEQLAIRGVEIAGLDRSRAGKFAYLRDPEGNPIELWGG